MHSFEDIRSHVGSRHALRTNDPYLISFDVELPDDRHQSLYLAELEDERERRYLRVSTAIAPMDEARALRCLRFNWEQRTGYLAVSDLDDAPYLHLCENRPYSVLTAAEIDRLIAELAALGDRLEQALSGGDRL